MINVIAPLVDADAVLTFELTVTDDRGATASDTVDVTVQNVSVPVADANIMWNQGVKRYFASYGVAMRLIGGANVAFWAMALLLPSIVMAQGNVITVLSPTEGQIVNTGEVMPVHIVIDESIDPVEVAVVPSFSFEGEISDYFVPFPYQTQVEVPERFYGVAFLDVFVSTEAGDFRPYFKERVQFKVQPDSAVEAVFATFDSVFLYAPPHESSSEALSVKANLANDQIVDVELAGIPVTFASDDAAVVAVSEDGILSAIGPGRAWVTIQHGNLSDLVEVTVQDSVTGLIAAPTDVSSNLAIQSMGFRIDPQTNQIVEIIRITNTSNGPLHRPFVVVVDNLPDGVVVLSPDGRTRSINPIGAPYMLMQIEEDTKHFMPGDSSLVELKFLNPAGRFMNHSFRVFNATRP